MKKALFTFAIVLLAVVAQAQIKVHDDNWVSIGCLTDDFGLQVTPIGYTYFRTQDNTDYSWATLSKANSFHQKHWIVENQFDSIGAPLLCFCQQLTPLKYILMLFWAALDMLQT